jgi:hypothetical protein
MPPKIATLPRDHRGFPVPWFVAWRDGAPYFPALDTPKWSRAIKHRLCWICGQPLGRVAVFPIGPMCIVNRITSEPGSHRDCAEYAVKVCPFLITPGMRRVPVERHGPLAVAPPGIHSTGNPGAVALWATREWSILQTFNGPLIELGEPALVTWWARGELASPEDAAAAFTQGAARLISVAEIEGEKAVVACVLQVIAARKLLPDPNLVREINGCPTGT